MNASGIIQSYLDSASEVAIKEVERIARKTMRAYPEITCFCMAMGTAHFYDADGPMCEPNDKRSKELDDFLDEYDQFLKITGRPMRLDSHNGKICTDW